MNRNTRQLLLVLGLITSVLTDVALLDAAEPADAPSTEAETRQLVAKLGSDDFLIREKAAEDLTKLGFSATAALEQGAKHSDREIRYRCLRILQVIRQLDFEQRLEAFIQNPDESEQSQLPGWERFRTRLGNSDDIRTLFVQMQRAEPQLLKAIQTSGKAAAEALATRSVGLQQAQQSGLHDQPLSTTATLLFISGESDVVVPVQISQLINNLCHQPNFRNAITGGNNLELKDLMRKMLGGWIRRGEDWVAYQGLMLAMQYDIEDGLVPAEKALKNPQSQAHIRQYAILTVAKMGNDSHRPLLLPMLDDKTVCTAIQINKVMVQSQVRDVALAALLYMNKQDPKKYGFDQLQPHPQYLYTPQFLGFENDDKRIASLKKWKAFEEEQKKPG